MSVKSKEMINEYGEKEELQLTSNDDIELNLSENYILANHNKKKASIVSEKFKGSILGTDIGFKSHGFTNVAILATVLAISAALIMYFMWRL